MNKMRRHIVMAVALIICVFSYAQTHVSFEDLEHWTVAQLKPYVGQTVIFDQPVYICNNYYSTPYASLHRVMSPTNQALPMSAEYNQILKVNNDACFVLNGLSGYHRMGEVFYGMKATINSLGSLTCQSYDKVVGTRADMQAGVPGVDMVTEDGEVVKHDLLVCAANLEYYLVENLGTGYGPANETEHQRQRTKVIAALGKIAADIYGLVEIEQGQSALAEIAQYLTTATGKNYSYIDDGGSASGSYTKSGFVYCSDKVKPFGQLKNNNTAVQNRKKMQAFEMVSGGERFIFSLNHFKAKSGASNATGLNQDQGDGQGIFNQTRVDEANSVLSQYASGKGYYDDEDVLIMGDLNAYAKEDPIMVLVRGGMTDLHRYFHADSSYSYTFRGQAGYLDHALCNATLLKQVTGMAAYHVNSDESDSYTYDKSNDVTMFRYSDHDPVLVGLKLGADFAVKEATGEEDVQGARVEFTNRYFRIFDAVGGHYLVTALDGRVMDSGEVRHDNYTVACALPQGVYVLLVYANGTVTRLKYFVP